MKYGMSKSELKNARNMDVLRFFDAEILFASVRTDADAVRAMLPKPLEPLEMPLATLFVARYPRTNVGLEYNEGALFLEARYHGERGHYCLAMPVTDDMAMVAGREALGYPKKMAESILLLRNGTHAVGSVIRKGTEILRIEATLDEPLGLEDLAPIGVRDTDLDGRACRRAVSFLFKHFPSPDGRRFDFVPRMIRQPTLFTLLGDGAMGRGSVTLRSSDVDPLGEVPVREVLSVGCARFDAVMLPGRVVAHTWNVSRFLPHAMFGMDFLYHHPDEGNVHGSWLERLRLRRKMAHY